MPIETSKPTSENRSYVRRYFWTIAQLAQSCAASETKILDLIASGCAPGPIYIEKPDEQWWTALGSDAPYPGKGIAYYSRGAAWGLRRALLWQRDGATVEQCAARLQNQFVAGFIDQLSAMPIAREAFSTCYDDSGSVNTAIAQRIAIEEWQSWLGGGYGVCLHHFTPFTCVRKESLGFVMKAAMKDSTLMGADEFLSMAEELESLLLPFAPWQRPAGTPGLTIDRFLREQKLGSPMPYS